ncbi:MAG: hypothetical protein KUF78_18885 [Candidatus Thiodiazotropha sp. (ex Lucina aurantia)]|nr:hypothetical protein [Candidatus Thiodiazotropha sp. (ex Codakia orbicularis)]MBV2119505.1 hypothetical protein [Candidatus Thiodiazotropha sp. (ex Lucina aurantia)]
MTKKVPKKRLKTASKKRVVAKRAAPSLRGSRKATRLVPTDPPGYTSKDGETILTPTRLEKPISPSKLQAGFRKAKKEIDKMLNELTDSLTDNYVISEIELTASFSADGSFLGFGVGGAATITIRIKPQMN